MKVFFDTNVYVAEALLGGAAEKMVAATIAARWRIFSSGYVLEETQRVFTEKLGFSRPFAQLTRERVRVVRLWLFPFCHRLTRFLKIRQTVLFCKRPLLPEPIIL